MAERKLIVTVEMIVRDMTQGEWDDAVEGIELDEDFTGPDGWVKGLSGSELKETIEGALDSASNPELFAGSDLYCVIERAFVASVKWPA